MSAPRIILCEKSSRWAIALRRALGADAPLLIETRSLAECGRELAARPASLIVVECTVENLEHAALAIADLAGRYPQCRVAGASAPALRPAEPLLREAGAISVVHSPRQARTLSRLAMRHLARAPQPVLSVREAILERLPWSRWEKAPFVSKNTSTNCAPA